MGGHALVRLEKGEELIEALSLFTQKTGKTSSFTVLGAATEAELGFYHLGSKKYDWKSFKGEFEIVGGAGNTAYFDGLPVVHFHITLAGDDYKAFGGHVRRLVVGATCEVTVIFHEKRLNRAKNDEVGLNLWNLQK